ncbi:MAG TPA: ferritin [Bacteroidales bacterium]|nr:ferritin [Bacteroidales bacterium]
MISKRLEKAINEQIMIEEQSSRIYLSMASWCEVQGLPGAAKFLYQHSDEERMHQLKFVHFLNDRGGHAVLQAVEQPAPEYKSIEELFDEVLKHEQFVTKKINDLVDICLDEKDHSTNNFLQWFVTEQIEEESLVQGVVDKIKLVGESKAGNFHIDMYLSVLTDKKASAEEK